MKAPWWKYIFLASAATVPALVLRLTGYDPGPVASTAVFGGAIMASAFLLVWAAEAAETDISSSLAIALLALIAVLPEYAVDLYFAYTSGHRPEYAQYAAANMTGSNRLLIGIGWPLVVLAAVIACSRRKTARICAVHLHEANRVEMVCLAVAGIFAFLIPLNGRIDFVDSAVLFAIYGFYLYKIGGMGCVEHEMVGTSAKLAAMPARARKTAYISLFIGAGIVVLACAEPFADSLVELGRTFRWDEFLLVQWLAPLASEAPELLVACILALKGRASAGLGALLSSKVNQWTLLVGSLPIAHALGGGGMALDLDTRQVSEFYLTCAQTVLGIAVLSDMSFTLWEALALLVLFLLQFAFPGAGIREVFAAVYMVLAVVILVFRRKSLPALFSVALPARSVRRLRRR